MRGLIPTLALLALLVVPRAATAAALTCQANGGVPPPVRSEGRSELVGDIVINCSEGTPTPDGAAVPTVDIQLSGNFRFSSRVLADPWSEALLLLDEPGSSLPGVPSIQAPCTSPDGVCVNVGNGQGRANGVNPNYYVGEGDGTNVNVFQGRLNADGTLSFLSVPLDPPGPVQPPARPRVLRLTNIRTDVSTVTGPSAVAAPSSP